jgi:hypothetical protein
MPLDLFHPRLRVAGHRREGRHRGGPGLETPVVEVVSANGEITYDQTRVARL